VAIAILIIDVDGLLLSVLAVAERLAFLDAVLVLVAALLLAFFLPPPIEQLF
jgi:hypothetical protein